MRARGQALRSKKGAIDVVRRSRGPWREGERVAALGRRLTSSPGIRDLRYPLLRRGMSPSRTRTFVPLAEAKIRLCRGGEGDRRPPEAGLQPWLPLRLLSQSPGCRSRNEDRALGFCSALSAKATRRQRRVNPQLTTRLVRAPDSHVRLPPPPQCPFCRRPPRHADPALLNTDALRAYRGVVRRKVAPSATVPSVDQADFLPCNVLAAPEALRHLFVVLLFSDRGPLIVRAHRIFRDVRLTYHGSGPTTYAGHRPFTLPPGHRDPRTPRLAAELGAPMQNTLKLRRSAARPIRKCPRQGSPVVAVPLRSITQEKIPQWYAAQKSAGIASRALVEAVLRRPFRADSGRTRAE